MSEPPPEASPPKAPPLWWRFAKAIRRQPYAKQLARLALDGYLAESGWTRSVQEKRVVTADGEPLPWTTYPFIDFIAPRLTREMDVFEYGAGASTLFYAKRVRSVMAVEHDEAFAAHLEPKLPANSRLLVRARGSDAYIRSVAEMPAPPHLVIVDGRDRVRCVSASHAALRPNGVLVLDDSERADYAAAGTELAAAGFRRLDFWGISPGEAERRCTTLFYRSDNVLGI